MDMHLQTVSSASGEAQHIKSFSRDRTRTDGSVELPLPVFTLTGWPKGEGLRSRRSRAIGPWSAGSTCTTGTSTERETAPTATARGEGNTGAEARVPGEQTQGDGSHAVGYGFVLAPSPTRHCGWCGTMCQWRTIEAHHWNGYEPQHWLDVVRSHNLPQCLRTMKWTYVT